MNGRLWRALALTLAVGMAGVGLDEGGAASFGQRARAATEDTCQPAASEAWSAVANWSCGHLPTRADSVTIPIGVMLTVDGEAETGNLALASTGTRLTVNSGGAVNIAGMLSSMSTPGVTLVTGAGVLRFVGASRALFGTTWSATTQGWRFEMALDAEAVGSTVRNIKAGEIVITSGTFSTTSDVRPDFGTDNTGSLRVAAGATLSIDGNIERTSTAGAACAAITVDGTLETRGARLSANDFTVNDGGLLRVLGGNGVAMVGDPTYAAGSTLEYAGSSAQVAGGELASTVATLRVANPNGVTLNKNTVVAETIDLSGGALATSLYTLSLAESATCAGDYDVIGQIARTAPAPATSYCFGHPHTRLTFTTGDAPSSATVTVARGEPPFPGAVARQFTIAAPDFAGTATVRVHYRDDELNGATEANLYLWRYDGARWTLAGRSAIDTNENYVELSGVTAFSEWAIAENGETTAATVVDFTAATRAEGVMLAWETADESFNAGFHVLRSDSPFAPPTRITGALIPSQAAGGIGGGRYTYLDAAPPTTAQRFYWVEDVDLAGASARHGPVTVRQALVWLPFVAQGMGR